jgi:bacterioferritin-associated ferredoxin
MYVCVCRAVTEETVRAAIDGGAHSVEAVTGACGAGDDCGACHQVIEQMIEARTGQAAKPSRRLRVVRAA